RRAAQEDQAHRLAADLAPYPAARKLADILTARRDGASRDHVIEAARALLASGVLPTAEEHVPWLLLPWLARGKKTDSVMAPQPIDEGGQGAVFRAVHKPTGIPVAFKRLRFSDDDSMHRMGREISIGRLYGEHPNVMPVLDSDAGRRWFVMPLANGSAA